MIDVNDRERCALCGLPVRPGDGPDYVHWDCAIVEGVITKARNLSRHLGASDELAQLIAEMLREFEGELHR